MTGERREAMNLSPHHTQGLNGSVRRTAAPRIEPFDGGRTPHVRAYPLGAAVVHHESDTASCGTNRERLTSSNVDHPALAMRTARCSLLLLLWAAAPAAAQDTEAHSGRLDVHSPAAEAGTFEAGVADSTRAPIPPPEGIGPYLLALVHSQALPEEPEVMPDQGCNSYENTAEVFGKVVLVRDGGCDMVTKYLIAEQATASGIIIYAGDVGPEDDSTLQTIGWRADVIVPLYGLYATRYRGERLRAALEAGEEVVVTLRSEPPVAAEPAPDAEGTGLALAVWPNPSRGVVALSLDVEGAQHVTVEVLDGLGRRVALLHNGTLAAGTHALWAELSALAAGAYFVRVRDEGGTVTRPLLLAR